VWGCLEEIPLDAGVVGELERDVRSAMAALGALDARLGEAGAGSLGATLATRRTLSGVLGAVDPRALRDACAAVETLAVEMEALRTALAIAGRLRRS
jgi:hypothetical protein